MITEEQAQEFIEGKIVINKELRMTNFNTLVNTDKIRADVEAAKDVKVKQTPAPVVEPVVI